MIEEIFDTLLDALLDSVKLLPFLFAAFLLLELIEHKFNKKTEKIIKNAGRFGPLLGGVCGFLPQCGFSAMASGLYATRVITLGTLFAVFLSTSDEMLLIMLPNPDFALKGLIIALIKLAIGIIAGFIIDFSLRKKADKHEHIHEFCENEHCRCDKGVFHSALVHTLKIFVFLFAVTLIINFAMYFLGDEVFGKIMLKGSVFAPLISSLIGLIPNCAASVAITQLYISNVISFGTVLGGLLVNSGVGLLVLFRVNRPMKQNFIILGVLYAIGAVIGIAVNMIGITL